MKPRLGLLAVIASLSTARSSVLRRPRSMAKVPRSSSKGMPSRAMSGRRRAKICETLRREKMRASEVKPRSTPLSMPISMPP